MGFFKDLLGSVSTKQAEEYVNLVQARERSDGSAADGSWSNSDQRRLDRAERAIPAGARREIERRYGL